VYICTAKRGKSHGRSWFSVARLAAGRDLGRDGFGGSATGSGAAVIARPDHQKVWPAAR
jgi:hypothetical protein